LITAIDIGGRPVGHGNPCFIIAEAGVNHNGEFAIACELVLAAKRAGADAVKFQTFGAGRVICADAPKATYQLRTTDPRESQTDMLRRLEMPADWHVKLTGLCREQDIVFLSTPYSAEDVDFLDDLGVVAFKLASIHCAEPFFVAYAARKRRPLIMSTGMATLAEVDMAMRAAEEAGNEKIVLLQCTTEYPARTTDANLRAIETMRAQFGRPIGYSDHTSTPTACVVAVALGASVIEKHITLNRDMEGPDHAASFDPAQFTLLVTAIREAEAALGSGIKTPCAAELANMPAMRRSLAARRDLKAGEVLTEQMVASLRPAVGLKPAVLPEILGRRLARDVTQGSLLSLADFVGA
jgi:N-acetylneuraminate synthase/N,N'-diacetyllegionaminate synthase